MLKIVVLKLTNVLLDVEATVYGVVNRICSGTISLG